MKHLLSVAERTYGTALTFFGSWNGFLAGHTDGFLRVTGVADFERLRRTDLVGVLLGLQNSEHFRSVEDVDFFHGCCGSAKPKSTKNAPRACLVN